MEQDQIQRIVEAAVAFNAAKQALEDAIGSTRSVKAVGSRPRGATLSSGVMGAITEQPQHASDISRTIGRPTNAVAQCLARLAALGKIKRVGVGRYVKVLASSPAAQV